MKQKVLVTGGSAGIGKSIAQYMHDAGWQVLVTGRNQERLQDLTDANPGMEFVQADISQQDGVENIRKYIAEHWESKLDAIVNNAGHFQLTPVENFNWKDFISMFNTHVIGPTGLVHACLPFLKNATGKIVNISSTNGLRAAPMISAYGSAKAAMDMLTKVWALELAPLGITVNGVGPGPVNTDVLTTAGLPEEMIKEMVTQKKQKSPVGRIGEPSDIAEVVRFLLTGNTPWLTGQTIYVDGGFSLVE